MWEQLKELPLPTDTVLYSVLTANTHYGKAIAWAATGNIEEAEKERALIQQAAACVPESRLDFPNKVVDILKVAAAMLDGELQYRRGNYEDAFKSLRIAIELDDGLVYSEPWGWMLPTRHPYGALLLEQGHIEKAAAVYAEDLGLVEGQDSAHQHPNNLWALHGYHECLVRLGHRVKALFRQRTFDTEYARLHSRGLREIQHIPFKARLTISTVAPFSALFWGGREQVLE
ncbi:hypothetical protein MRS44_013340 [Fusarium solani]|uniref:uncharacterized protein n=1 Tax=Fusarium solani TaxID=169388 RepID=UPI0032C42F35|nr:hypothetical protein MRS44_013340 [Fusarium solani]